MSDICELEMDMMMDQVSDAIDSSRELSTLPEGTITLSRIDFGGDSFRVSRDPMNSIPNSMSRIINSLPQLSGKELLIYNNPFSADRLEIWMDNNPSRRLTSGNFFSHSIQHHDLRMGFIRPMLECSTLWLIAENAYFLDIPMRTSKEIGVSALVLVRTESQQWLPASILELCKAFSSELVASEDLEYTSRSSTILKAFDRLILEDSLITDIRTDLETFMSSKNIYKSLGVPWKRGYMLIGPPGTGKSLLLRQIAEYYDLQMLDSRDCLRQDGALDFRMHSDHGKIDRILHPGKSKPTLIILEDIDKFVTYQSEGREKDAGTVTLHDMLKALDGVAEVSDTLFIATTNYPNQLSEALINRPGRFDRIWHFELPTQEAIIKFFIYHNLKFSDCSHEDIALHFKGFSMAFVEEFIKSIRSTYKRNTFTLTEVQSVLDRIAKHNEFCSKIFGKGKTTIGFSA